jgi:hypothetical protein
MGLDPEGRWEAKILAASGRSRGRDIATTRKRHHDDAVFN